MTPLNKIISKFMEKNEDTAITRSYEGEEYWGRRWLIRDQNIVRPL